MWTPDWDVFGWVVRNEEGYTYPNRKGDVGHPFPHYPEREKAQRLADKANREEKSKRKESVDEKCGKAWKRAAIITGKNYPGASKERKGAIAAKIAKDIAGEKEAVESIVSGLLEQEGPWLVFYDSSEDQYRVTKKRLGFPAKLLRSGFATKEDAVKFARDREDGLAVSVEEST